MFYAHYFQFAGELQADDIIFDEDYTEAGAYLYSIPTAPHMLSGFDTSTHYLLITSTEWDPSALEAAGGNVYETVTLVRQEDSVVRAVWNQKPPAAGPELMDLVRQMTPIIVGEDSTRPATPADFWNKMKAWNVEYVNG
jgi:hypothetical protein